MKGEPAHVDRVRDRVHSHVSDIAHAEQVAFLAERLFYGLAPLHALASADRDLLVSAGLLHDIGWSGGRRAHHRRSCEMIRSDRNLPFEEPDRTIVALVARYHRRALPDPDRHSVYGALDEANRARIRWLGGMLRLADRLDHDHERLVADLRCDIDTDVITVRCRVRRPVVETVSETVTRADLLEEVGGLRYRIVWERA